MPRVQAFAFLLVTLAVLQPPAADAWLWRRKSSSSSSSFSSSSSYSGNCKSPSGNDCSWYRNCLEAEIPCRGTGSDYAIAYAEKFCDRYTDNYNSFSSKGKQWVNAVRKCLQLKLVPFLSQSPRPSCYTIKRTAFDSHVPCYTNPGYGAPSFCDLSWSDRMTIMGTILPAFGSELIETIKGGIKTLGNCLG